jgi:hypothetical protein
VAEISEPIPQGQKYRANEDRNGQGAPSGRPQQALASELASLFCLLALDPAGMPRPIPLLGGDKVLEPPVVLIEVLGCRRDNVFRPKDFSLSEFNRIEVVPGIGHEDVSPTEDAAFAAERRSAENDAKLAASPANAETKGSVPCLTGDAPDQVAKPVGSLSPGAGEDQRVMRLIFEPSRLKLYISPCASKMKAMTGLVSVSVSMAPPAPTVTTTTDPSTPTFQP